MKPLWLLIYGLATFRLAVLFSQDTGPWNVFSRFRSFLKKEAKTNKPLRDSRIQTGIDCLRCSSLELAIPVALYAIFHDSLPEWIQTTGDVTVLALALSAAAILFHRMYPSR